MEKEMITDEQHIFVCEKLLGWKYDRHANRWYPPESLNFSRELPPLTLDWLHDCENKIPDESFEEYYHNLCNISRESRKHQRHWSNEVGWIFVDATAEQRLAALVETIKNI